MARENGQKAAEISEGDRLAKESDVTVGSSAVPPETEYYGFALYVGSSFVLLVYVLWAFLPREWLHAMKIYYYPSRWWAVAFPSLLLMTLVYIYVALASYNVEVATRPLDSPEVVTDDHAKVVSNHADRYLWTHSDGVWDIPIADVNRVLYSGDS